jgi:hypothetical protein
LRATFSFEVVVVVAGVAVERAVAQLEDAGAEGVEERAVVGDDDQAAGVAREVVLKPEQRLEIEVVGRLVEQQQRGLGDEQAGEMGAHDPAAGKRAWRAWSKSPSRKPRPARIFFARGSRV